MKNIVSLKQIVLSQEYNNTYELSTSVRLPSCTRYATLLSFLFTWEIKKKHQNISLGDVIVNQPYWREFMDHLVNIFSNIQVSPFIQTRMCPILFATCEANLTVIVSVTSTSHKLPSLQPTLVVHLHSSLQHLIFFFTKHLILYKNRGQYMRPYLSLSYHLVDKSKRMYFEGNI